MHGVLPSRKTSHPPPYTVRGSRLSTHRRRQLQLGALIGCAALFLLLMIPRLFGSSSERIPLGTPEIVVVTLIDEENMSKGYIEKIQENRRYYASRQGMIITFASPCKRRTVLSETVGRIHDLLPKRFRLQHRRLPPKLGPRSRPPPRTHRPPTQHLFLRSLPSCAHNEPRHQPQIARPGEEEARIDAA